MVKGGKNGKSEGKRDEERQMEKEAENEREKKTKSRKLRKKGREIKNGARCELLTKGTRKRRKRGGDENIYREPR